MSDNSIEISENEQVYIRNKISYEVDTQRKITFAGAHDRPAIFIERDNYSNNDSTTLIYY